MRRMDIRTGMLIILTCWLALAGPVSADCIDYTDYLHHVATLELGGEIADLATADGLCYALDRSDGLKVIDLEDPADPQLLASLTLEGSLQSIHLCGTLAVIAAGDEGIHVVDVALPTLPTLVGTAATGAFAFDVALVGNHAYVACGSSDLYVVAISADSLPQVVCQQSTPGFPTGIAADGSHVFMADGFSGLRVYDAGVTPQDPQLVTVLDRPYHMSRIDAADGLLAVHETGNGVAMVDITSPGQPALVQVLPHTYSLDEPSDLELAGSRLTISTRGHAYIYERGDPMSMLVKYDAGGPVEASATLSDGAVVLGVGSNAVVLDAANPSPVAPVGSLLDGVSVQDVLPLGDRVFAASNDTLFVVDISDPQAPTVTARVQGMGYQRRLALVNSTLIVGTDDDGIYFIDVTDPDQPSVITRFTQILETYDMELDDGILYVLAQHWALFAVNVDDPAAPAILGRYEMNGYTLGVNDGIACVGGTSNLGVEVIDFTDPGAPVHLCYVQPPGSVESLSVDGQWLYYIQFNGLLHMVDLSDPASPVETGTLQTPGWGESYAHDGTLLYVGIHHTPTDAYVFDVSDPTRPLQIAEAMTGSAIKSMELHGDHLLTGGSEGFRILPRHCSDSITPVNPAPAPTPSRLSVEPNPFNPLTRLAFELQVATPVRLVIHDVSGRAVRTLEDGTVLAAGRHEAVWDGRDDGGRSMASGVYVARLEAGAWSATSRMALIR